LVREVNFAGNDLALLQFRANGDYAVASLGTQSTLKDGDEVFAAGFPFDAYWSGPGSLPSQPADCVVAKTGFNWGLGLVTPMKLKRA